MARRRQPEQEGAPFAAAANKPNSSGRTEHKKLFCASVVTLGSALPQSSAHQDVVEEASLSARRDGLNA